MIERIPENIALVKHPCRHWKTAFLWR